jgi:protein SCO1/2
MLAALLLAVATLASLVSPVPARAHDAAHAPEQQQRLPTIRPAPGFDLVSQDGSRVALRDFRGKVAVVTFIYTSCQDTCPLLTSKMAQVQDELGPDFGSKIVFLSITVDPERDAPDVLQRYAQAYKADLAGWTFLTGTPHAIREVTHRYGVFTEKTASGDIEHTFLTSLVDQRGMLRVQYVGVRFDPDALRRDLLSLLSGP